MKRIRLKEQSEISEAFKQAEFYSTLTPEEKREYDYNISPSGKLKKEYATKSAKYAEELEKFKKEQKKAHQEKIDKMYADKKL
jgi:uncharacterized protein YeaO (DUF488 family)